MIYPLPSRCRDSHACVAGKHLQHSRLTKEGEGRPNLLILYTWFVWLPGLYSSPLSLAGNRPTRRRRSSWRLASLSRPEDAAVTSAANGCGHQPERGRRRLSRLVITLRPKCWGSPPPQGGLVVQSRIIGAILTVDRRLGNETTPSPDADQFVAKPATSSRVSRCIGLASKLRRDNRVANPHGASSPHES